MLLPTPTDPVVLLQQHNLDALRALPDNCIDAIVTDPPYGLGEAPDGLAMLHDWLTTGHHEVKSKKGFMGKAWDAFVPQPAQWAECLRVLKPGGHLLAFAGTRTQDLIGLGLRIAGFEIRDLLAWIYGSGFPKSLDISKAIDKHLGAEREKVKPDPRKGQGHQRNQGNVRPYMTNPDHITDSSTPATAAATAWQGWGTALKPAQEPITLARKPIDGRVASNVLAWSTGGINIAACRVEASGDNQPGRWPANVIHDGSEEVLAAFPYAAGSLAPITGEEPTASGFSSNVYGNPGPQGRLPIDRRDGGGSAARFFYCAKTSASDRNAGCEGLPDQKWEAEGACIPQRENRPFNPSKNNHPTVKPTALMQWLCRLITPPGGIILDPWLGSGSTGKAARLEGFLFLGIENEPSYLPIARARIAHVSPQPAAA